MNVPLVTQARKHRWVLLTMGAILALTALQLRRQGRIVWCACGHFNLWDGDIWSSHNSQHVFDPYSFTHVLHGMLFFWALTWLWPRVPLAWRLVMMTGLEALWEIVENAPFIIQRYREATIGQGYTGDSIVNSMADIVCCGVGFLLARALGWRLAVPVLIAVELALLVTVRDNLTLNILMLTWPIDSIKAWQMVH